MADVPEIKKVWNIVCRNIGERKLTLMLNISARYDRLWKHGYVNFRLIIYFLFWKNSNSEIQVEEWPCYSPNTASTSF